MNKHLILPTLFVCLLVSCNDSNPAPDAQDKALTSAQDELSVEQSTAPEYRAQAKHAVEEYMKQAMPEWKVEGIGMRRFEGTYFHIEIDASHEKERKTFSGVVQLFTKEDGSRYWKAEGEKSKSDDPADGYATWEYTHVEESSSGN